MHCYCNTEAEAGLAGRRLLDVATALVLVPIFLSAGAGMSVAEPAPSGPGEQESAPTAAEPSPTESSLDLGPSIEREHEIEPPLELSGWLIVEEREDLDEALERAREQGMLLLLLLRSHTSHRSNELERSLVSKRKVETESARFVRAVVSKETRVGAALLEEHSVLDLPTMLFLAPDGREARRLTFMDPSAVAEALRAIADGGGTMTEMVKEAARNPFDIRLAFELGRQHALRGDVVGAKRHFARLFVLRRMLAGSSRAVVRGAADVGRLGDSSTFGEIRSFVESDLASVLEHVDTLIASAYFMLGEYGYLRGREDHERALEILDELRRRFPDSPESLQAGLSIALSQHHLGSSRRARAELARHLDSNSDNPDVLAEALLATRGIEELEELAARSAGNHLVDHEGSAALWSATAALHEARGDLEAAVGAAREAAKMDEGFAWYGWNLARLKTRQDLEAAQEEAARGEPSPDEARDERDEDAPKDDGETAPAESGPEAVDPS